MENEFIKCPDCDGQGDIPYYTREGDKECDACELCKGEKVIPAKKKVKQ